MTKILCFKGFVEGIKGGNVLSSLEVNEAKNLNAIVDEIKSKNVDNIDEDNPELIVNAFNDGLKTAISIIQKHCVIEHESTVSLQKLETTPGKIFTKLLKGEVEK